MKPFFLFLFLSFFSININSQIPNGDFEEWEVDMNGSVSPFSWEVGSYTDPDKIFKSTESYSGNYSLGVETHYGWVVIGPARIRTKFKPTAFNYHLSLQCKIDSIVGNGAAYVSVYRENSFGIFSFIAGARFELVDDNFAKVNLPFSLQNLDTVIVSITAVNQEIDIGWTGYTRVLFDALELHPISASLNPLDTVGLVLYPNPANGSFRIINLKEEHKVLKIINALGRVVHEQMIDNDVFYFREEGVFFIALCNRYGEALEVIKLINR